MNGAPDGQILGFWTYDRQIGSDAGKVNLRVAVLATKRSAAGAHMDSMFQ